MRTYHYFPEICMCNALNPRIFAVLSIYLLSTGSELVRLRHWVTYYKLFCVLVPTYLDLGFADFRLVTASTAF